MPGAMTGSLTSTGSTRGGGRREADMPEYDCRHCKSWRGCPGKAWYSYGEIRWCAQQTFWILKHAYELESGEYPQPNPDEAEMKFHTFKSEAYFVKATLLIAQIRARLKFTGWRGRLLAEESINREKMLYLSDDAKQALYYVAGSRPKDRTFSQWVADRRYRKSDKNIVFSTT